MIGDVTELPADLDRSRPHVARMYDYFLGGTANFEADRAAAEGVIAAFPAMRSAARENRAFLGRTVRYLAGQAGIRQFLDIGAGLPTASNVHQVAQAVDPACRVVYVDNDPLVIEHGRTLLAAARPERPEPSRGQVAYVHADLRDPQAILDDPVTRDLLDFTQPVALLVLAVLHFFADDDRPGDLLATLLGALPPGSYLVSSQGTSQDAGEQANAGMTAMRHVGLTFVLRDSGDFARLAFSGLDLLDPGVVPVSEWRPDPGAVIPPRAEVGYYGAIARKA